MNIMKRIGGVEGFKVIVGSGFFWAWMDALFMSVFFVAPQSQGLMSELAFVAVFACSLPVYIFGLGRRSILSKALMNGRFLCVAAIAGVSGSLLFMLAGLTGNCVWIIAGGVLAGFFMAILGTAWGGCYCKEGSKSAIPYVTGAFAFAPLVDAPLLCMVPRAAALFFAVLPLVSVAFLVNIKADARLFKEGAKDEGEQAGLKELVHRYLGISTMLVCAVMLVTGSFGYMQHLISFSPIVEGDSLGGVIVQLARGLTAVGVFAVYLFHPRGLSVLYRVGFLVMVAGVVAMPFFFEGDLFAVPATAIIAGYTVFDVFIRVAFSYIAAYRSRDSLKTIVLVRFVSSSCSALGALFGIAFVGRHGAFSPFVSHGTTVVGYLIVIAIVLILSSEGSREFFSGAKVSLMEKEAPQPSDVRGLVWEEAGLTAREREVAELLVLGRTQPWIAESLNISESTVATHVRHIYRKTDVHDRQELIDLVVCLDSSESDDDLASAVRFS